MRRMWNKILRNAARRLRLLTVSRPQHLALCKSFQRKRAAWILSRWPKGKIHIPEVPFTDYIFENYEERIADYKDRPWIVDVPSGTTVTFGQVKRDATKIASALARRGFRQGDVLYFVTYEFAHLNLLELGVWMLGGVVRGCYQGESHDVYSKQISESSAKFVVVDSDTINVIKQSLQLVDFEVELLSLGNEKLEGTTHFSELLEDDGLAFVKPKISDPKKERLCILNTSGSTGYPKGVVHTHFGGVAYMVLLKSVKFESSIMEFMINYGVGVFGIGMFYLLQGYTVFHINKFDRSDYFNQMMKHKPKSLLMYPFVANWFARCESEMELLKHADFLKLLLIGGWVLDPATADLMYDKLPNTHLEQIYGMTEIFFATCYQLGERPEKLVRAWNGDQIFTSSGIFLPGVEGKIIDMASGETVGPHEVGELYVKSPCNTLGYLKSDNTIDDSTIFDGWLQTGDVGFLDESGNLYIKDRAKFIYKYKAVFVLPTEIEAILHEHPAVQESGVVGVPDLATNNLSRAYVVLKPGRRCSEQELCDFVASKLPEYKQLHGGVKFIEKLPISKGGKLDRKALKDLAMAQ